MKILLVRPSAVNILQYLQVINSEPLELEYLHTVAKEHNWEDMIYDGFNSRISIKNVIKTFKPDVIAITGYITQEKLMLKYCECAKKINPAIITVIGGVHAQINHKNFYGKYTDFVFRSEDMKAFSDLLTYFETKNFDISKINGLCINKNGVWVENELKPFDVNSLPIPNREFFYQNKSWFRYIDLKETATVKSSISCPYNCKFCYCTKLGTGHYSVRDLDKVIEEIEGLECENVLIADDVFLFNEQRIWNFISEIKKRGIKKKFICYGRSDYISSHPEQMKALVEIGFIYFLVGLESSNDSELENYNKQISEDNNIKCLEVLNSLGARCFGLMIVPIDAKKEYFDNLYKWVVKNNAHYVTLSIFTPMPGTSLYDEYKDKFTTNDCTYWDFLHLVLAPVNMSALRFYYEFYKLTFKLYKITKKTGIFSFMNFGYYKHILCDYFSQKLRNLL